MSNNKEIKRIQFSDFTDEDAPVTEARSLSMLLDIPLELAVELGRASIPVRNILGWEPGSIFEVNKLAGEPVDVMVKNQRIAKGEVLVLDDNFGIRITEVVSERERLSRLNQR